MRFNAKLVVVFATIIGAEWVRAAPRVIRCTEKCDDHQATGQVTGIKIDQHKNKFEGGNIVGAEVNQTENQLGSSQNGNDVTGVDLKQSENVFQADKKGGKIKGAVINQHGNIIGGESTGCKVSRCKVKKLAGDNKISEEEDHVNGDSTNASSGGSASTTKNDVAGDNEGDDVNGGSTNVSSGGSASTTNTETVGNNKENYVNGATTNASMEGSAPAIENNAADDNKRDHDNESSINVSSKNSASITNNDKVCNNNKDHVHNNNKDKVCISKEGNVNEGSTNVPSESSNTDRNNETNSDKPKVTSCTSGDVHGCPTNVLPEPPKLEVCKQGPTGLLSCPNNQYPAYKFYPNGYPICVCINVDRPTTPPSYPPMKGALYPFQFTGYMPTIYTGFGLGNLPSNVFNNGVPMYLPTQPLPGSFPGINGRYGIGISQSNGFNNAASINFSSQPLPRSFPGSYVPYGSRISQSNNLFNSAPIDYSSQPLSGSLYGLYNPYGFGNSQSTILNNEAGNVQIMQKSVPLNSYHSQYSSNKASTSDISESAPQNTMYLTVSDENIKSTGEPQARQPEQSVDRANFDGTAYSMQFPEIDGNGGVVNAAVVIKNNDKYGNLAIIANSVPFSELGPQYKPLADNQVLDGYSEANQK